MATTSPFKFLDAYTKEDKAIFFGREAEVEQLYQLVFQSNLTLVYGQSGSGKTSLVRCGLANRFEDADWFDIYIRKNKDINQSLLDTLQQFRTEEGNSQLVDRLKQSLAGSVRKTDPVTQEAPVSETIQALRRVYKYYFRPLYLIFDQFEELFTFGSWEEQFQFYQTVSDILKTEPYCRTILVMREEIIARLYHFEQVVPQLFDNRLRVEPITPVKTREIIVGTLGKVGVAVARESIPDEIVQIVRTSKEARTSERPIELTHLQILLDRLYRDAHQSSSEKIVFDQPLVAAYQNIDDVLAEFLSAQLKVVQRDTIDQFSGAAGNVVQKVFGDLVLIGGTKRPLPKEEIATGIRDRAVVQFVLKRLEEKRLIRWQEGFYEPAHDILAQLFNQQRSEEEVTLLQTAKIVRDRYQSYDTFKTRLTGNELTLIHTYQAQLRADGYLEADEWDFVEQCRKRNVYRKIRIWGAVALVVAVLSAFAFRLYQANNKLSESYETNKATISNLNQVVEQLTNEKKTSAYERYKVALAEAKQLINKEEYGNAVRRLEVAKRDYPEGTQADSLIAIANADNEEKRRFEALMDQGDTAFERGGLSLLEARKFYRQAQESDFERAMVQERMARTEDKLNRLFMEYKDKGDLYFNNGRKLGNRGAILDAKRNYEQAAKIRPKDAYIQDQLRKCEAQLGATPGGQ